MKLFKLMLLFSVLFTGCTKDDDPGQSFNLVNEIQFTVKDGQGNNLIPDRYNSESIKLYSLDDGEPKEIFNGNLDYPRNFRIIEINGENVLVIWPVSNRDEEFSTTLIEWEEGDRDTIETTYSYTENATILQEVWFNGELILSHTEDDQFFYELSKD